jgi:hypothetical protein
MDRIDGESGWLFCPCRGVDDPGQSGEEERDKALMS